uniref:PAS domain-containing protein n=1 Tax=Klebsiella pneumoniae TaxID=573 RepID=UPI001330E3BF
GMIFALVCCLIITIIIITILNISFSNEIRRTQEEITGSLHEGVIGVNKKGKIVLFNSVMEKMSGLTAQKAHGQHID